MAATMPSDAAIGIALSACDGRYRVYQHNDSGMFYLCAFTRQAEQVTRRLHGPLIKGRICTLFVTDAEEAQGIAARLNVRIG